MNRRRPNAAPPVPTLARRSIIVRRHNAFSGACKALFMIWTAVCALPVAAVLGSDGIGPALGALALAVPVYAVPALILGALSVLTADRELREIN